MEFGIFSLEFFVSMEIYTLIILCFAAFAAGFVDAVVGGGGLIQTPVALIVFPKESVATLIGTLKIPAFSGTSMAARQYVRQVALKLHLLLLMGTLAFCAAFFGSWTLTQVNNAFMKPVLFIVLIGIALYTFIKKDFGQTAQKSHTDRELLLYGVLLSLVVGFYDGFIGPGTGSFLVLGFIVVLGFDFLQASAHAKIVNLATNLGSILLFTLKGKIIWTLALPMALANALGGWLGAKTAIAKGNQFIRKVFLIVVIGTLLRFAWDIF
ncbi:MAG: hypothetical protein RLZZ500_1486 [Bacteroidota bacterium]